MNPIFLAAFILAEVALASDTTRCSSDTVLITWNRNKEPDLAGYKLYWGENHWLACTGCRADLADTFKIIWGFPDSVIIAAAVTAYDTAGNESDFSQPVFWQWLSANAELDSCDVNGDGVKNQSDKDAFKAAFGARRGYRRYSERADFDRNGIVDGRDHAWFIRFCW